METLTKITITKVNYTDKKKDGEPILNKWGKPSYKTGIKTNEFGDEWLNGFLPFPPDKWEGTTQEVLVFEDEKWGKQFKLPPKAGGVSDADRERMTNLENKVTTLTIRFNKLMSVLVEKGILEMPEEKKPVVAGTTVEYPESIDPSDIPFD